MSSIRSVMFRLRILALVLALPGLPASRPAAGQPADTSRSRLSFATGELVLELDSVTRTVTALRPASEPAFDFTPGDRRASRAGDGYYHLGDLTLRIRTGGGAWRAWSSASPRLPAVALRPTGMTLAASTPPTPDDWPLEIRRLWVAEDATLALRFEIENTGDAPVEIGALGIPMVFDNILRDRNLDEAHAVASFHDPYIGLDAGYVQVTRLNGHGPALLVVPEAGTPFEGWRPLLDDPTPRGVTFEGFHEWMPHTAAYAQNEWRDAEPWNAPTSTVLAPGEIRRYGVRFLLAPAIRAIEETLAAHGRPVAVGLPGYVLPTDQEGRLFVKAARPIASLRVEPEGALDLEETRTTPNGWHAFSVRGRSWGRARLTIGYEDGTRQTVHYRVIEPAASVVDAMGRFLTHEQWFDDETDPFGRAPGVITYDGYANRQVSEDHRVWIAGLGDEGGSGSWLAAVTKELLRPEKSEIDKLVRFVDETLWGGLQYTDAHPDLPYGVRKSLFWYDPDAVPPGTYSDDVPYGGWPSWSREHAETVGRSYNYPHVAAAYWILYRLARTRTGLVTNHDWTWYLERAWHTGVAMTELAPEYAQFGQMEGTVFVRILEDLRREGWNDAADRFEGVMRERAEHWRSLGYPFGSEMPWDSTGQEEVYAWCRYFGFDEKARITLDAILAYMPSVPHWGYHGSARRYWDFQYAGHPRYARVERQLHHYGSALNALPVLAEYRLHPDDLYLLRVGYAGMTGALANVTRDGYAPSAFHAWPSTLRIDGYTGDYGPGFLGHALNTGAYLHYDAEFRWLGFGGNVSEEGDEIVLRPVDSGRRRVHIAPADLWLTLDAGSFESVRFDPRSGAVAITLAANDGHTPTALLRIEQPASGRSPEYVPTRVLDTERGAFAVPLGPDPVVLDLTPSR